MSVTVLNVFFTMSKMHLCNCAKLCVITKIKTKKATPPFKANKKKKDSLIIISHLPLNAQICRLSMQISLLMRRLKYVSLSVYLRLSCMLYLQV